MCGLRNLSDYSGAYLRFARRVLALRRRLVSLPGLSFLWCGLSAQVRSGSMCGLRFWSPPLFGWGSSGWYAFWMICGGVGFFLPLCACLFRLVRLLTPRATRRPALDVAGGDALPGASLTTWRAAPTQCYWEGCTVPVQLHGLLDADTSPTHTGVQSSHGLCCFRIL